MFYRKIFSHLCKGRNDDAASARASKSKQKQRGFYDLTQAARVQSSSGSITRVEEFGLSSVSEEANVSDADDRPASANSARTLTTRGNLRRKTASSDNILENKRTRLQPPVSFSMDKLCADVENNDGTAKPAVTGNGSGDAETSRNHGGKGGLIKRRMLGSIRGLMASTHLLQTNETDEVLREESRLGYASPFFLLLRRMGTSDMCLCSCRALAHLKHARTSRIKKQQK